MADIVPQLLPSSRLDERIESDCGRALFILPYE